MVKRPFRRPIMFLLFGALSIVVAHGSALADSYSYSGKATRWYHDPPGSNMSPRRGETYDASGKLELGEPTIHNNVPGVTGYNVRWPITYSFLIGDETYTGTGLMLIRPIGCGALFDCWFQNPLSLTINSASGEQHHWQAFDGAFFHANGSLYPSVFQDTLAYAVPPGRFDLYGASFVYGPTFEVGPLLYEFDQHTMVFNRIQRDPVCSAAQAFPAVLWSPNHQFVPIIVMGVTDPDGDAVTITVTGVTQDEPVNAKGDGNTSPDAVIEAGAALVRAERSGKGNGRVYQVSFKAKDGKGGSCTGAVTVGVPHSLGKGLAATDDGQVYDSTIP